LTGAVLWHLPLRILSRLAPEPYRSAARALNAALAGRSDHPLLRLLSRIQREVAPPVRRRFWRNVLRRWLLTGSKIRGRAQVQFPPVLLLSLTDTCNYRCKGCYAAGHEKGHQMDPALVDRLIREAEAHGTNYFVILGGEPFLWPHLILMLRNHPEAWFQVYTNGSLIDRQTAVDLRKVANVQVMISLEGLRDQTDARREAGAFDNCIRAMAHLRAERLPFGVGITCYRSNVREVVSEEFVREMISRGCLFLWYFYYMPYGDLPEFDEVLTPEDRAHLYREVVHIRSAYPVIAADQIADCTPVGGCAARAGLALHIAAAGLVEPCAQMHFSDCSIHGKSILEVLKESEFLRRIRSPAAEPSRACFLQDCCSELQQIVRLSGARDNTGGRDTQSLAEMASRVGDGESVVAGDLDDPYAPLTKFFFEMLSPVDASSGG